jgi:hypothetical protein
MSAQITAIDLPTTDKESIWKEHAQRQKESGLSRVAYCRKHQLSYDQFGYWFKKWRQQSMCSQPIKLLPIYVNKSSKMNDELQSEAICTLAFKNGHALKIHDKSVLTILLSLWG